MKRLLTFCLLGLLLEIAAGAQTASNTAQTLLVLPFENISQAPGLEWISEAFPAVMGQRMSSRTVYTVPREDRLAAFERAGLPANVHPSHASMFLIGEQMDVDYLVLGRYTFDGRSFTAMAQLLDVKHLRLSPEINESGPLTSLIDIQTTLAWDLLRAMGADHEIPRSQFLAAFAPVRLDAFESYIRGLTAPTRQEKLQRLRDAVRLEPSYALAMLELGRTYFAERDYDVAASWLSRISRSDPAAREASFYAGLAYYFSGDLEHAESAFSYLASVFPLTEVYNNLGVVAARRGRRNAVEYFEKTVEADPNDPDYHFNLGLALLRAGELAGAARQFHETLKLRPGDTEAKNLLDVSAGANKSPTPPPRLPLERIKRNYDETLFRQLALEIQNTSEQRLTKSDPRTHAAYRVQQGYEMLRRNFVAEAAQEFQEALALDPANASAHAGLAAVLEINNDSEGARREAHAALQLQPSVEAYLVLARLDLRDNHPKEASANAARALELEPANATAADLQRAIAARLAGGAQP